MFSFYFKFGLGFTASYFVMCFAIFINIDSFRQYFNCNLFLFLSLATLFISVQVFQVWIFDLILIINFYFSFISMKKCYSLTVTTLSVLLPLHTILARFNGNKITPAVALLNEQYVFEEIHCE